MVLGVYLHLHIVADHVSSKVKAESRSFEGLPQRALRNPYTWNLLIPPP
jgi:hypothetical protein